MWSTWRGPADPGRLSKLCVSRAAYPRQFARRCGFTWWQPPPLRPGPQGALGRRTLGTLLPRLPHERTNCSRRIDARRGNAHRTRRTRRSCAPPALCGAGEPCAHWSNRPWEFDDEVDNCVAGKRACSTARVSRTLVRRTSGSHPDPHANPHAWAYRWTASWPSVRRAATRPG